MNRQEKIVLVEGRDLHSLLYNFLEEIVYIFSADLFVTKRIEFLQFKSNESALIQAKWSVSFTLAMASCLTGAAIQVALKSRLLHTPT
jgi:SHS2 domain-containing protein